MPLYCAGNLTSLYKRWAGSPRHRQALAETTIEVPIPSLDQVLTDAKAASPIDFLSIDVEGHASEALEGIDIQRWRPRLILVEDHVVTRQLHRSMLS